ncbi:ribosome inactivating protein precursor [Panicum miliaceum]|uniref:rRNA N-glycosylase n=1 Tax=Panicum miliaceum TaxID=4540 RepID=A0A3L6PTM7_PANMI|nr:ribosome inactivating protein precursor [Panicum miliaceum]
MGDHGQQKEKNSSSACKQRLTSWRTDHHPRLRKESRLLKKEEGKPSDKQECRSINMPPGLVESRSRLRGLEQQHLRTLQDKSVEELGEDNGGSDGAAAKPKPCVSDMFTQPGHRTIPTPVHAVRALLKAPSNPPYHPRDIDGRYVLGPRRSVFKGAPLGWTMLHVTAGPERGPANSATLALAEDDLYLFGFANGSNHWYFVEDFASGVQGAATLPFPENYGRIIDGGHKALWKVPLGKGSAVFAATTMATYNRARSQTRQIKDAFIRSIVMYCEAIRFKPIRMAFSRGDRWEHRTYISGIQATWIVHWGQMSTLSSPGNEADDEHGVLLHSISLPKQCSKIYMSETPPKLWLNLTSSFAQHPSIYVRY